MMNADNEERSSEMRDEMREHLADLREEMVEHEAQGLVQIVASGAVAPEAFAAEREREDAALTAYYAAKERRDRAESALDALSCRTSFTYEVEGPEGEEGVYVIDEECTWPADHAGEHRGDRDESDAADPTYTQALHKFQEAADVAGDKREQWEDAEEALDALRCNQGPAGEWPCTLRRGHDGEHEHPTELHLVG